MRETLSRPPARDRGFPLAGFACAALLLGALAFSCSDNTAPGDGADAGVAHAAECASRDDCDLLGKKGKLCSPAGQCERCTSDGQCELKELCDPKDQACVFRQGWGEQCALNGECPAGQLCVQGLCKPEQDVTLCVAAGCLADGQRCNQANQVCEEDIGCVGDADCSAIELCNLPTHTCVLKCTLETQAQICAPGQRCVDRRCADCAGAEDCLGGLVCDPAQLKCVSDGALRCATSRDCAVGLVCDRGAGFCTPKPPPCVSNESCMPDERCDLPSGLCLRRACQPDRLEPNPGPQEAPQIVAGSYPGLTLCDREQDWVALKLSRGDNVDVFVDADPLVEDYLDARLLDDTGRIVAQGSLAVARTVSRDGTYYLRLESTDAFVSYGLRVSISRGTPCDDDRFEPDDDAGQAAQLHAAGEVDKLTLCPLDVDFYAVDVPVANGVRVEVFYVPTEGDIDLELYDASGRILLGRSATTQPTELVEVTAAAVAGPRVLARVFSADTRTHGEYYLRITYLP